MNWRGLIHPGGPLEPHDLWSVWNVDPWLLIPLAVTAIIYLWGTRKLWRRAGLGRGICTWRFVGFFGGILALFVALISPLDALSNVLFSAHMTQHMTLMLVAAPLLVTSSFPVALVAAFPRNQAQALGHGLNRSQTLSRIWNVLSRVVSAWLLFAMVLWIWHAPRFYEAALQNETVHTLEHLLFLLTAMLYWWILFRQTGQTHFHYGRAVLYLFTTVLHSGILGALMTFTSQPWYSYYVPFVKAWGLTPLQDQQLAGLIMWMPGGAVFTLMTIRYFVLWLRALEQRSQRFAHNKYVRTSQKPNP
jgi:putative membrane protein